MPELPEVEVTKRALEQKLLQRRIGSIVIHNPRLRFPIPAEIREAENSVILGLSRRSKYIFLKTGTGTMIIHLGMTGHIRIDNEGTPLQKHDHYEFFLDGGEILRYNDPRRFGALLWTTGDPCKLSVIASLGVEPLTDDFTPGYLFSKFRNRSLPVKQALMDNKIVVGVGNIYANEVLFLCKIDPRRPANSISLQECTLLVAEIRDILTRSIMSGGTTIRDYAQVDGKPGYFAGNLRIYGKTGQPCTVCGGEVQSLRQGQRSTFFCSTCQK